ncbi:MAG: acyl-CoA thioesterase [Gammaproteobacteria bacterium]
MNTTSTSSNVNTTHTERELAIQVVAQPKDVNAAGDIFGGWLVSQMDLAGAILAERLAAGRVATVAIDNMVFIAPVAVGALVSCYTTLIKIGNTSVRIQIDVFATTSPHNTPTPVASGHFTFVALDHNGRPRPVQNS